MNAHMWGAIDPRRTHRKTWPDIIGILLLMVAETKESLSPI
jgi:hypothetical protein